MRTFVILCSYIVSAGQYPYDLAKSERYYCTFSLSAHSNTTQRVLVPAAGWLGRGRGWPFLVPSCPVERLWVGGWCPWLAEWVDLVTDDPVDCGSLIGMGVSARRFETFLSSRCA
jgi:hypothetical protein